MHLVIVRTLAFVIALVSVARAQTLANAGFESGAPINGLPTVAGAWAGDVVQFVGPTSGITPREGAQMIQFINTSPSGPTGQIGSEAIQLIDLSPQLALVQTGNAIASIDAWCNRVAGDATTDTEFLVTIRAYSGAISQFPLVFNHGELALVDGFLLTDSDPTTWQRVTAKQCLPPTATYLAIRLAAVENVVNDTAGTEFAGHFGDDLTFTLGVDPLPIESYCVSAPNSVGPGATITAAGSTSIAANNFTLLVSGAPHSVPGLFFYGAAQGQAPFGDGWRCVQGTIYRLGPPLVTDPTGALQRQVDFTVPPASFGTSRITPASCWGFQFWYRNVLGPGGTGFNLTNGLGATFCP